MSTQTLPEGLTNASLDIIDELVDGDRHLVGCLGCYRCDWDGTGADLSGLRPCLDVTYRDWFHVVLLDDGTTILVSHLALLELPL